MLRFMSQFVVKMIVFVVHRERFLPVIGKRSPSPRPSPPAREFPDIISRVEPLNPPLARIFHSPV